MLRTIVSERPIRPEPPGATSEQIAHGHANERLPWADARPGAVFSARVRMEPKSSGILGMFRGSRFNLRARSKGATSEHQPEFRHVITNDTGNLIEYSTRRSRQRIASHSPNRHSANS
jgi:hypothetical protein